MPWHLCAHYESVLYGAMIVIAAFTLIKHHKQIIAFKLIDFLFLSFIIWIIIANLWAYQPSLGWDQAFFWLINYIGFKWIQTLNWKESVYANLLSSVCVVSTIVLTGYIVYQYGIGDNYSLNQQDILMATKSIIRSPNYIASLLAMLLPFTLYNYAKSPQHKILKLVILAFQAGLIMSMTCRSAVLGLSIASIVFVFFNRNRLSVVSKRIVGGFVGLIVAIISVLYLLGNSGLTKLFNPFASLSATGEDDRLLYWKNSIEIWKDNPLSGIGGGNWKIVHQQFDYGQFLFRFDNATLISHPHNIYVQYLVEYGLGGFLLFISILFLIVIKLFKKRRRSKLIQCAFYSFIIYLTCTFFIGILEHDYKHMSGPQTLVFMIFAGIAFSDNKRFASNYSKVILSIVIFVSSIFSIFFIRDAITWSKYLAAKESKQWDKAATYLQSIYHPNWKTYMQVYSIPLERSFIDQKLLKQSSSLNHLQEALQISPNHALNHYRLGLAYRKLGRLQLSKKHFRRCIQQHSKFIKAYLELAELALEGKNPSIAKQNLQIYYDEIEPVIDGYKEDKVWMSDNQNANIMRKYLSYQRRVKQIELLLK